MIKTDYKPRKLSQPIFSEQKRLPLAPVIMAVMAVILVLWGLGQSLFNDDPATDEIKVVDAVEATIVKPEPATNTKRFAIPLDLDTDEQADKTDASNKEVKKSDEKKAPEPLAKVANQIPSKPTSVWKSTQVKSGDSTARVFQRNKLSATDLHNIMQLGKSTKTLERIQAGHEFEYALNAEGELVGLKYHIDRLNTLEVSKVSDKWQAKTHTKPVEVRQASASGTISSSLFLAGKNAGLSDALVMELAGIFGWDIDFILDIREGDGFTVIYEEKYVEGVKYNNGNILAAEFVNRGKSFQAIRYTDSEGNAEYYNPEGLSMRKAFLRAPLDFSYVSSRFNPKRFHPVLKRVKAHRGIDYKAPIGTPVRAAGDGKVIRSGYDKYNGHHVFIQHGQKYTTKYLHFSKRKVRNGQRVKQGEVIGYLGRSGMVTGAHLHYEFLVNGVHRNPRTVKLPDAEPVKRSERQRFIQHTTALIQQLKTRTNNSPIKIAEAN